MEIIDCHVNITKDGVWGQTKFNSGTTELLRQMDEAEVGKAILLPIRSMASNKDIYNAVKQQPDRFIGFGNLSYKSWQKDVQEITELNLKGIKFHPRIQNESIQQWDTAGVLNELQNLSLPILVCGWTQSKILPIEDLTPLKIDLIAKKYPSLKIIIAHLGGHNFWDAFFVARSNANVYLDISYFLNFFRNTSFENDFYSTIDKIDKKIIFGTDFPEVNIKAYKDDFLNKSKNLHFDRQSVLSSNIKSILTI
jgi:predicted TIM-barrel fold metal-dependent hydrolase